MTTVFLDTDVILDVLLKREPFAHASGMIVALGELGTIALVTSTVSLMNVLYIVAAATDRATAVDLAQSLRRVVGLVPVTSDHVDAALASGVKDPEDYVQYASAKAARADYLVTRNVDDYPREPGFVMSPAVFLKTVPM